MRAPEPHEPEVLDALEALDATLAGEPVDPEQADIAELALLLRALSPLPDPAALARLDARAARRFAPLRQPRLRRPSLPRVAWSSGAALAVVILLIVGLVIAHPGGGSAGRSSSGAAASSGAVASSSATVAAKAPATAAAGVAHNAPVPRSGARRDIAQTARIALRAGPGEVDHVAQEVYDTVGAERGYVLHSHVVARAGSAGSASFALSVPSDRLSTVLSRLSDLRGAEVTSREDASADITGEVGDAGGALATVRALHVSLVRRLAAASSTSEVDRLITALRRNAATITRDSASLARLRGLVSRSAVAVTVSAPARGRRARHRAGFGVARALSDAGRGLEIAAGVAIVALAILLPVALLAGLAGWGWSSVRRRRREAALG